MDKKRDSRFNIKLSESISKMIREEQQRDPSLAVLGISSLCELLIARAINQNRTLSPTPARDLRQKLAIGRR